MIKFTNACRKGCPWLIMPTEDTEDFMDPECKAFDLILERDEDPESEFVFKCDECKKVTHPEKVKNESIDSLAHSLAIMSNRFANVNGQVKKLQASLKTATEAFKTFGEDAKKHNLKNLIAGDPNNVEYENVIIEEGGSE